jgi:hypothetical protein
MEWEEGAAVGSSMPFDIDEHLDDLFRTEFRDRPMPVRLAPTAFLGTGRGYQPLRGVSWTTRLRRLEEAQAFRESLQLVFKAAQRYGWAGLVERLQDLLRIEGRAPVVGADIGGDEQ